MLKKLVAAALAWAAALVASAEAQEGRWLRAESASFTIYSNESEPEVRRAAEQLERFDRFLRFLTRVTEPSPARLEVYLLNAHADLRSVSPGIPDTIRGFYSARAGLVAAFAVNRTLSGADSREILFHEYAHHFMMQHFNRAYPSWFVEGFAEYVQTARIEPARIEWGHYSAARAPWITSTNWASIEDLIDPPQRRSPEDVARFYAMSWLLTHYIFHRTEVEAQFNDYLARVREGQAARPAFEAAFAMRPEQFQQELYRYTRRGIPYRRLAQTQVDVGPVTIARMPASANALLPLVTRLRSEAIAEGEGPALLQEVRALAARFPGDPYAERALARAEIQLGAPAAGRARLAPVIASDLEDVEAYYLTGLSYVVEARAAEEGVGEIYRRARPFFAHVFRRSNTHVPTLYRYTETFAREEMTPQALDVMIHAYSLAPQVSEIGLNLAPRLMRADRYEEAVAVLRPIATNPHGGTAAEAARAMLVEAERGARPARPIDGRLPDRPPAEQGEQ